MKLGYNTNGFAHHRLDDAVAILADLGYESVAITLEPDHLDPPDQRGVARCVRVIEKAMGRNELAITIETGSRFILDPRRKHQPTLVSAGQEDRRVRVAFIEAAIEVAGSVGADVVSLWSGAHDDPADQDELWRRLSTSLQGLLAHVDRHDVRLCFEPEPGMFVERMEQFDRLATELDHPQFGLTLDVGHVHCLQDGSLRDHILRHGSRLWNVHLEDMRYDRHEHLMFGEGDLPFDEVFDALREIDYGGPLHVELSRHSHDAVETARRSIDFIRPYLD